MKPIPRNLLIHSASLKSISLDNAWQDETLSDICTLSHIRIEPSTKIVTSKDNKQVTLVAILIYDCYSSKPKSQVFTHGQKIVWNGTEYTIETIEKLYDGKKLHHYELGLI